MPQLPEYEDLHVSVSSVGAALYALDDELKKLTREEENLIAKRLLINQRMDICHQAIKKLLIQSGYKYQPTEPRRFHELNHAG